MAALAIANNEEPIIVLDEDEGLLQYYNNEFSTIKVFDSEEWKHNGLLPPFNNFPNSISELTALKELRIEFKGPIPDSIENLQQLEVLELTSYELTEIPESIGKLVKLKELIIDADIKEIPDFIGGLPNLEILEITGTHREYPEGPESRPENVIYGRITEIPESILNHPKLKVLKLDYNQIREIPESIRGLTNLSKLSLNNNKIKEIPESMKDMTKLGILHLENNPLNTEYIIRLANEFKIPILFLTNPDDGEKLYIFVDNDSYTSSSFRKLKRSFELGKLVKYLKNVKHKNGRFPPLHDQRRRIASFLVGNNPKKSFKNGAANVLNSTPIRGGKKQKKSARKTKKTKKTHKRRR